MNTAQLESTDQEPTLRSTLRALPRPVWILFFGTFLNKFGSFVVPFLALYLTQRGYTLADAGLAIGGYGVGNFLACIVGGHLADHFGRRKTIVLSMFSAAAAMMLLAFAESLPVIILLAAAAGLTGELYRPAASALLADLVPAGQRVSAFAAYRVAFNAGWAFGPATAGLLAEHGYFWLFVGDAVTSVLYGIVALVALPRGVRSSPSESGWTAAWKLLRSDRQFHRMILAAFAVALVFFQMASTFGLHVTQSGFSATTYGILISLNGALVVLCELPLTSLTRRYPTARMMAAGYVLIGIGFSLIAVSHTLPALVVCVVIFTLGEMVAMPMAVAAVADLAPADMRGRYMGSYSLTWALALVIGPAAGMELFKASPAALWLTCGALAVLGAAVISRTK